MTDGELQIDQYLFQLVLSLQMAAMQNMGKIMSPITGKIERNLEQARVSIDMLGMLADKTKGNLNNEENKFLSNILHELRLNFTDESSKPEPATKDEQAAEKSEDEKEVEASSDKSEKDDKKEQN